jgi:hypothetical protein
MDRTLAPRSHRSRTDDAAVFRHRIPQSLFKVFVCLLESRAHMAREDALCIRRQIIRDVFEREKSGRRHQKLAEQERRGTGLLQDLHGLFRSARAGIVFVANLLDGFKDSILLLSILFPEYRQYARQLEMLVQVTQATSRTF